METIPTDQAGPDTAAEAVKLKERILKEIAALSENNRLVTALYFIDGYSYNEISDFLAWFNSARYWVAHPRRALA